MVQSEIGHFTWPSRRVGRGLGKANSYWLEIDTGMGRLGFWWEDAAGVLPDLAQLPGLNIQGMYSHFASSDGADHSFAEIQYDRFLKAAKDCERCGMTIPFKHMSNSGAILHSAKWDMNAVRPGILFYGYGSSPAARPIETKPFLQWKTKVVQVKEVPAGFHVGYNSTFITERTTMLATIDTGYADGYPRLLSNKGSVIIQGRKCPVIGNVTMNFISVDLGPGSSVVKGDEVTLIGAQGGNSVWADEIAELCATISYEILTNIQSPQKAVVDSEAKPNIK